MYLEEEMRAIWMKEDLVYIEYLTDLLEDYRIKVNKYVFESAMREHMKDMLLLLKKELFQANEDFYNDYGTIAVCRKRSDRQVISKP